MDLGRWGVLLRGSAASLVRMRRAPYRLPTRGGAAEQRRPAGEAAFLPQPGCSADGAGLCVSLSSCRARNRTPDSALDHVPRPPVDIREQMAACISWATGAAWE